MCPGARASTAAFIPDLVWRGEGAGPVLRYKHTADVRVHGERVIVSPCPLSARRAVTHGVTVKLIHTTGNTFNSLEIWRKWT
ncbi:hypothetical protein EYF80_059812 [Liparis tanakae]|uniref:Uncharacterized protein n=1 Tax=Liparis tanakae TaxID=230148 RepID=A0A4Z2EMN5_9TELE|nr:hypothetical protein EYF80_059812 [Liparis tanakae]